jgi:hypothetical protein
MSVILRTYSDSQNLPNNARNCTRSPDTVVRYIWCNATGPCQVNARRPRSTGCAWRPMNLGRDYLAKAETIVAAPPTVLFATPIPCPGYGLDVGERGIHKLYGWERKLVRRHYPAHHMEGAFTAVYHIGPGGHLASTDEVDDDLAPIPRGWTRLATSKTKTTLDGLTRARAGSPKVTHAIGRTVYPVRYSTFRESATPSGTPTSTTTVMIIPVLQFPPQP